MHPIPNVARVERSDTREAALGIAALNTRLPLWLLLHRSRSGHPLARLRWMNSASAMHPIPNVARVERSDTREAALDIAALNARLPLW
ncbi:hypothetical protein DNK44_25840, partial [Pseudomonas dryadis]